MSVLQTITLSQDTIKTRWREPYVTAGLNQKAVAGDTRGVVMGFKVVPSSGYSIEIQADPTLGLSIANVLDTATLAYSLTLVQVGSLYIDLTAQAGTTVFIALDAQYSVGTDSAAQLRVVDAAELLLNVDLIVLAKVNVPATPVPGPPVTVADINTGYRTNAGDNVPLASIPPTNLVQNPGFETGTTSGWYGDGTWTTFGATASASYEGNYALQLFRAGVGSSAATSAPMPVAVGLKYRVCGRFRTAAGLTGIGARLQVGWFDGADAQIGGWVNVEDVVLAATVSPPFTLRQSEVTAPNYAINARLRIFFDACSGFMYADDFRFLTTEPMLQRTAVFAGPGFIADAFHSHSAGGGFYSGSVPPAPPFSGWSLPAGSVEATFDQIVADLGATSGATRIGNAPSKILNNVFVNGVPNTASIDATGNGNAPGIIGRSGSAINTPGGDFISTAATTGPGVKGLGSGTGPGVKGTGGASSNSYGGEFTSSGPYGNGVLGQAVGVGVGVEGRGGINTSGFGGPTLNPPAAGLGNGGTFMGATGDAGGDGLQAWGRANAASRTGVLGVGGFPTISGTPGGAGGQFYGGTAAPTGNTAGGHGVIGVSGAAVGTGSPGDGVRGLGNSLVGAIGVRGISGLLGIGVQGEGVGPFSVGVRGLAPSSNNTSGVFGKGTAGFNTVGVAGEGGGLGSGGSFQGGELGGVGVIANGTVGFAGVAGTGNGAGAGVTGGGGGTSGVGVIGTGGGPNGYGVRGVGTGTGVGVAGLANGAASTVTNTGVVGKGNTGGWFESTQTNGTSLYAPAPLGNSIGIQTSGRGSEPALDCFEGSGSTSSDLIRVQGNVRLTGDHLNGNVAKTKTLAPNGLIKACCQIQLNNTVTPEPTAATLATNLSSAFNISSVSQNLGTARITVNFASAFANATDWFALITFENNYGGTARVVTAQTDPAGPPGAGKSTTSYTFILYDGITGVGLTAAQENGLRINFVAIGRQ